LSAEMLGGRAPARGRQSGWRPGIRETEGSRVDVWRRSATGPDTVAQVALSEPALTSTLMRGGGKESESVRLILPQDPRSQAVLTPSTVRRPQVE